MEMKFYRCEHCGNIVAMVKESGVPVICCGEAMKPLVPNTVEAAHEKHIPVLSREGERVTVTVGSVAHPMLDNHYIEWIELIADGKVYRQYLNPGETPEAEFCVKAATVTAREFCNLHGQWKTEL